MQCTYEDKELLIKLYKKSITQTHCIVDVHKTFLKTGVSFLTIVSKTAKFVNKCANYGFAVGVKKATFAA